MLLFSLSWRQGWVGFTCTDSGSMALSVLDEFSCAWSHLHVIRACFVYNTYWIRFRCIRYFTCISGKKLTPSSRYIPSIHQGPLLPMFLARFDVRVTFVWVLTAVSFCIPPLSWSHAVSWVDPSSLSMMTCTFISISEDSLLSYFNPWFIIHFRPL